MKGMANLSLSTQADFFDMLPDDCWFQVMLFLDPKSILRLGMTCKRAHYLSKAPHVWRPLVATKSIKGKPITDLRKYYIDSKMVTWRWHHGLGSKRRPTRILIAGQQGTGKSSLVQAIRYFLTHPEANQLKPAQLSELVASSSDVTAFEAKKIDFIFYEVHGKDGRVPRFRKETVDCLLYCVDEAT